MNGLPGWYPVNVVVGCRVLQDCGGFLLRSADPRFGRTQCRALLLVVLGLAGVPLLDARCKNKRPHAFYPHLKRVGVRCDGAFRVDDVQIVLGGDGDGLGSLNHLPVQLRET